MRINDITDINSNYVIVIHYLEDALQKCLVLPGYIFIGIAIIRLCSPGALIFPSNLFDFYSSLSGDTVQDRPQQELNRQ